MNNQTAQGPDSPLLHGRPTQNKSERDIHNPDTDRNQLQLPGDGSRLWETQAEFLTPTDKDYWVQRRKVGTRRHHPLLRGGWVVTGDPESHKSLIQASHGVFSRRK